VETFLAVAVFPVFLPCVEGLRVAGIDIGHVMAAVLLVMVVIGWVPVRSAA